METDPRFPIDLFVEAHHHAMPTVSFPAVQSRVFRFSKGVTTSTTWLLTSSQEYQEKKGQFIVHLTGAVKGVALFQLPTTLVCTQMPGEIRLEWKKNTPTVIFTFKTMPSLQDRNHCQVHGYLLERSYPR